MIKSLEKSVKHLIVSILLIASTFVGVSLNGGEKGWIFVNGPFRDFLSGNHNGLENHLREILYVLLIIFSVLLFVMPFFLWTRYRKQIIAFIPPLYLLLTIAYFPLVTLLCIPFLIVWVCLLVLK